ncbi:MAG: FAD-dependent oxidoreductase [Planctomycetaceae bacterium]
MIRTALVILAMTSVASAQTVLVEAESFENHGGWKLDTQFIETMGSPYLLAHGLGRPVKDAMTTVTFPKVGKYRVLVRTKDWVAPWGAKGTPGRFQLLINGKALETEFGTEGAEWHWQDGGDIQVDTTEAKLSLRDLTGFNGRCDAICFVTENGDPPPFVLVVSPSGEVSIGGQVVAPDKLKTALERRARLFPKDDVEIFADSSTPNSKVQTVFQTVSRSGLSFILGVYRDQSHALALHWWRKRMLGLPDKPEVKDGYDLVVVGGGYAGVASALSAARMGCKVALIQNRPVLGGNGSSEVRVWAMGNIRRGRYPRIGEIVEEFCDRATKSPGTYEEFEDDKKEAIVAAEKNIDLFLNHHAYKVDGTEDKIDAIYAFDTRTSAERRFEGRLFADCTGHGTIGYLAKANWEMTPKGRMGMSNMWAWDEGDKAVSYPDTPWALDLTMKDFPYPRDHHGQWFWEGGFDKDPIKEAELIRDWNLRAVYGAFNAMKNKEGAAKHKTAFLTWIAYIGGPRESRRLMGDVVLTQEDVVSKRDFKDGCVPSTWSIDLHYPRKEYADKFPENPFISVAVHDRRIDRGYGYPVPYRCFYSKNINNLFMAGRCVSVTHEALGTTRVMKTCGMMGEVVGKAASVCVQHDCFPREVYTGYWSEMERLLKLPGKARRKTVDAPIDIPDDIMEMAGPRGPITGLNPKKLPGLVVDDRDAEVKGKWQGGGSLKGYVGYGYRYAPADSGATAVYRFKAPATGEFDIRIASQPHPNRAKRAVVKVNGEAARVDMTKEPNRPNGFIQVSTQQFTKGQEVKVRVETKDAGGMVHLDAIQVVPAK